ncbi:Hypothetical Protein FCC1311_003712 [Hondaea fermentalgiana]|uniref:Uncharacterized protein n=1 Tax=Hondaea fermentalgiana TaxID=2315210 RepID=A0A2R5G6S7_9STRA|nr:Hypothetical Protein FCC1311_003712 [Hondaea fermentalgiana]|eukprot:GBG24153.1 Hypothetical Protein FCC1311_003712 [Hondaea fermentalgiana]
MPIGEIKARDSLFAFYLHLGKLEYRTIFADNLQASITYDKFAARNVSLVNLQVLVIELSYDTAMRMESSPTIVHLVSSKLGKVYDSMPGLNFWSLRRT